MSENKVFLHKKGDFNLVYVLRWLRTRQAKFDIVCSTNICRKPHSGVHPGFGELFPVVQPFVRVIAVNSK